MAGQTLTTGATLQCPHGGKVQISGTNQKTSAGSKVCTDADTFSISGCSFQLPMTPPVPSPCKKVMWMMPDLQVTVGGAAALSRGSVGLCLAATGIPQGVVMVSDTGQTKVKSR